MAELRVVASIPEPLLLGLAFRVCDAQPMSPEEIGRKQRIPQWATEGASHENNRINLNTLVAGAVAVDAEVSAKKAAMLPI